MELVKAAVSDLEEIRNTYINIINRTPDMEKNTRWVYGIHPNDQSILNYINKGEMFILRDNNKTAGLMALANGQDIEYKDIDWNIKAQDSDIYVIHILAVNPDYANKGTGTVLINEAVKKAEQNNKKTIRLDALKENAKAINFYKKNNFIITGYKTLNTEDSGILNFVFLERVV